MLALLVFVLVLMLPLTVSADGLQNGNFETYPDTSWVWQGADQNSTTPISGLYSAYIGSGDSITFYQTGLDYNTVNFNYKFNSPSDGFWVSQGGEESVKIDYEDNSIHSFEHTSSESSSLSFRGGGGDVINDVEIDDIIVSLSETPTLTETPTISPTPTETPLVPVTCMFTNITSSSILENSTSWNITSGTLVFGVEIINATNGTLSFYKCGPDSALSGGASSSSDTTTIVIAGCCILALGGIMLHRRKRV